MPALAPIMSIPKSENDQSSVIRAGGLYNKNITGSYYTENGQIT